MKDTNSETEHRMKKTLIFLTIAALLSPCTVMAQGQERQRVAAQSGALTVDQVKRLVEAGVSTEIVVKLIQQNPSNFDMSVETIDSLRNARVPTEVLNAMLKAGSSATGTQQGQPAERSQGEHGPPPPGGFGDTPRQPQQPQQPADAGRIEEARNVPIPDRWTPPARQEASGCPDLDHSKARKIELDIDMEITDSTRLCESGTYCFALRNANPLYDWSVKAEITEATGNPFDLLNDAIQTLKNLGTGAPPAAAAKPAVGGLASNDPCPPNFPGVLADVEVKAATFRQLLAALIPGKDSSGKTIYIPHSTTVRNWQPVPAAFDAFEEAVRRLQQELKAPGAVNCPPDKLRKAEAIILDDYPKVRTDYQLIATKLSGPTVLYHPLSLDPTSTVKLVATPSYAGVPASTKTYLFGQCYAILSASAGFLLTGLQARTYASATAPDPADQTKTQNQLRVDYGAGIRPALTALLTGNIPYLNRKNFGLGVTGGLVFDVSSGKADTSRFGFFGGPSVRVTPWIFLTPGVHIGEFADFPQGFNRPGQVIPPNTGTPTPTKRYTGKFAFSITWKIRDLGASTASNEAKPK
jgi:hypothetical protein